MNLNPLLAALLTASVLPAARGEEVVPPVPARLVGDIPDGTPPAPEPPKQALVIPPSDILESESHQQAGRTITIQQVRPLPLPAAQDNAGPVSAIDPETFREQLAEYRAQFPKVELLGLGATVYRSQGAPPRTLLTWWNSDQSGPISVWSSADFTLIAGGINEFVGTDGTHRRLFLLCGEVDLDRLPKQGAASGNNEPESQIPAIPDGPATFVSASPSVPVPQALAVALTSLHSIYQQEYPRLLAARESRENFRQAAEAVRKANPPQPQNITLSYWHSEGPAPVEGGDQ